jgi:hypothetical protein
LCTQSVGFTNRIRASAIRWRRVRPGQTTPSLCDGFHHG